ncbi:MAG TPA: type II secretion system F family protein [Cellulomonadaceae bacterium]|nr:type II secretion system F family protein [Cellulomonadaceae bacterium]
MSPQASGAIVGALGGIGLVLVWWRTAARRITLDERLAPYLRVQPRGSRLLRLPAVHTPFPTVERLVAPVMSDALRLVARFGSPSAELRRRLEHAGRRESVEEFRASQVVWGVVGLAVGLLLALVVAAARGTSPVALLGLVGVCGATAVLVRDHLLTREVHRREARIVAELPTVAELLALAVGAGEGPVAALERVVATTRGEMAGELSRTLADARSGTPLTAALEGLADRTEAAALTRFAEGVAIAVERGTPLADVLRAQAQDAREAARRALMETGGRKEVAMMVPVVFLILPVTVVFAVFPSLAVLSLRA